MNNDALDSIRATARLIVGGSVLDSQIVTVARYQGCSCDPVKDLAQLDFMGRVHLLKHMSGEARRYGILMRDIILEANRFRAAGF